MRHENPSEGLPMSDDDKRFLLELGKRIAARRKAQGLTQAKLGELLGFSQPHIQAFESGRRRISVTELPKLANVLGIAVEDLLGLREKRGSRGRPSRLEKQFEVASRLPKKQREYVSQVLEAILDQAGQSAQQAS